MNQEISEPRGIAGWLVLPAIGVVLSPILLVVFFVKEILPFFDSGVWSVLTTPGSPAYHPLLAPLVIFETVTNLAILAASIYILVLFFGKKRRLPKTMIVWLIAMAVVQILDIVLSLQIPVIADAMTSSDYTDLTRSIIVCAIWVPYFSISRRVKNTFVA